MILPVRTQTLARAYNDLASGREGFRVAIGNFMNAFFLYYPGCRQQLIDDPILVPEHPDREQRGWAAFCAGAAEYLAMHYGLHCPAWAHNPAYRMPDLWCILPGANERMLAHLQETTPVPWKTRNICCGNHVFSNQHPSSREPGSYDELIQRREARLADMTTEEREAYHTRMAGRPRVTIVT
jgi:hypothetical protein